MTAPDPMPLPDLDDDLAGGRPLWAAIQKWEGARPGDDAGRLAEKIDAAVRDIVRRHVEAALEAEKAEVFRLQASHSALYAEVEALRDALAKGVPEGWKLAPSEATTAMDLAGMMASKVLTFPGQASIIFKAMLAATPPSPAQAAGWRDIGEGELWSWTRSVMCQGADIRVDYDMGTHKSYEAYSARLDTAANERSQELMARLMPLPAAPGHPPSERQGLTDEQIMGVAFGERFSDGAQYLLALARAIERAHGIGIVPATPESAG